MAAFKVRVIKMDPMTIASAHALGESPEREAWRKMEAWAGPLGLLDDVDRHPVFGFNNPNPSPGSREYGYEFWLVVESELEAGPGIEFKRFEGGLYAVTSCHLLEETQSEFFQKQGYLESWQKLYDWVKASPFRLASHQPLEKPRDPRAPESEMILDLYAPIKE